MLDTHDRLLPGEAHRILGLPAYSFFVSLGLIVGLVYYFYDLRQREQTGTDALWIAAVALVSGVIGSKIPQLLAGGGIQSVLYDKSIVGALLGGMFGVIAFKKIKRIKLKMGNVIAPAAAIGIAIGRLGCFFSGCCYGVVAAWGFDFGDGQLRLPTQLFESTFHLIAFLMLINLRKKVETPGLLFKLYLLAYFIFRFVSEFFRENLIVGFGMSIYQIICVLGLLYITIILRREASGRQQHAAT
ncbi:MAG: prolipoprotein diacylglyceryl transferase [Coriobacteriia bacterium]|nr:prolipoprotein diacylglyceryl transferase [Coriobacteriia bacterium]